ncbi:N-acyl-phosphatidylethanolamine-hydrolyzing phospholipase D-like [Bolinopsis microptera]|uniref:N-acyl-phosphatidylethanolamine-hydrolyzing phospholipase D-like n=1 Tax=Bolinopsis microptera TaxID=2820187 RepID=UPI00307AE8F4
MACSSGGDQGAESKCSIKRDPSGYFNNPFPEFRFLSPFELFKLARAKNNKNLPSTEEEIDQTLPYKKNFDDVDSKSQNTVTWIGHSSCLLKMSGIYILTDPVFSQKRKRFRQPGLSLEEIDKVDAVVISHDHYDHLDYNSVIDINKRFPSSQWFVPLGLKSWFESSGIRSESIHEMNWWEEKSHTFQEGELTFTCLPAQHWSMRIAPGIDMNYSLWCGWRVMSSEKNVYFAGDTGYNNRIFRQIGNHCGPFDLSLIPIGAYEPREYLKCQHVNPEEAVKVHDEVNSKLSLGIHWGTLRQGKEHYLAPPRDLKYALEVANINEAKFVTFQHGECREI